MERQPGKLGIGHGLGHQHQGAGNAGNQVAAQDQRRNRKPGEKGKKTQHQLICHE